MPLVSLSRASINGQEVITINQATNDRIIELRDSHANPKSRECCYEIFRTMMHEYAADGECRFMIPEEGAFMKVIVRYCHFPDDIGKVDV